MYRVPPAVADTEGVGPTVAALDVEHDVTATMRPRLKTTAAGLVACIWW
jgi:hypothetical protein